METSRGLSLNSLWTDEAPWNTYRRFQVDLSNTSQSLCIKYRINRVEPVGDHSDPDLFVSRNPNPEIGIDKTDNYTWKSATAGTELVQVHPGNPDYACGTYYISVFGSEESCNRFTILCYLLNVKEIVQLTAGRTETNTIIQWSYYKIPVNYAGDSRLEFRVAPGFPELSLFISPTQFYPSERDHLCSAGFYKGRPPVYDPNTDFSDPETLYEIDPFDKVMPRDYVPNPKNEGERLGKAGEACPELVLCLDTDEWICTSQTCYLGVRNNATHPHNFSISGREVQETDLLSQSESQILDFIKKLYSPYDLVGISYAERLRKDIGGCREFTYGEVDFVHFRSVLEFCDLRPGQEFWDLGSGAGKCLLTVACTYPDLRTVTGVEMLDDLFSLSQTLVQSIDPGMTKAPISLVHGDIFQVDWSSADCIYTSNLCFPEEQLVRQADMFRILKSGAKVLSLVRLSPRPWLHLLHSFKVKMTWGKAEVFLYDILKDSQ